MNMCIYEYMYVSMYEYMCNSVCVPVCLPVCVPVRMCAREREKECLWRGGHTRESESDYNNKRGSESQRVRVR